MEMAEGECPCILLCAILFLPHAAAKIGVITTEELESKQSALPPNEQGQLLALLIHAVRAQCMGMKR